MLRSLDQRSSTLFALAQAKRRRATCGRGQGRTARLTVDKRDRDQARRIAPDLRHGRQENQDRGAPDQAPTGRAQEPGAVLPSRGPNDAPGHRTRSVTQSRVGGPSVLSKPGPFADDAALPGGREAEAMLRLLAACAPSINARGRRKPAPAARRSRAGCGRREGSSSAGRRRARCRA